MLLKKKKINDEKEYCLESKQLKNIISNDLEGCKLSEIYYGYDNLILLHGMSRICPLDREGREMFMRYSKIKELKLYGYLIKIGKPFKKWCEAGAIIKESKIIAL